MLIYYLKVYFCEIIWGCEFISSSLTFTLLFSCISYLYLSTERNKLTIHVICQYFTGQRYWRYSTGFFIVRHRHVTYSSYQNAILFYGDHSGQYGCGSSSNGENTRPDLYFFSLLCQLHNVILNLFYNLKWCK